MSSEKINDKIARLKKELEFEEAEQEMVERAYCPICGEKMEYSYEHRDTAGEGNKLQRLKIKCTGCKLFGIEKEAVYNVVDVAHGRCEIPIDVLAEWKHIKQYLLM